MKIGLRVAALAGIVALLTALVVLFNNTVQLPAVDWSVLTAGLSTGMALLNHYLPGSLILVTIFLALWAVWFAEIAFKFARLAFQFVAKWVMQG